MSFLDRISAMLSSDKPGSDKPGDVPAPAEPPHALRQHFAVSSRTVQGFEVYSVAPMKFGETSAEDVTHYDPHAEALDELTPADAATQAVLYVLPGGFAQPIKARTWDFIAQLANAGLRVEIPLYGLIPEYNCAQGLPLLSQTYRELVEDHGAENITIIADSAGASPALGMFIARLEANAVSPEEGLLPAPRKIILNAPWVDMDLGGDGVEKYKDKDPILDPEKLRPQGNLWAQGLPDLRIDATEPTAHPAVSPLNLDAASWPTLFGGTEFHVFCGDRDLSYPSSVQLTEQLTSTGLTATFHPKSGATHMFHLGKSREGKAARKVMAALAGEGRE